VNLKKKIYNQPKLKVIQSNYIILLDDDKKKDIYLDKFPDYDNEAIARKLQMEYDEKLAREMYFLITNFFCRIESDTNFFKKKTKRDEEIAINL